MPEKTHLISLTFDDGFLDSFTRIAEIHESFGLSACLNVVVTAANTDQRPIGWGPPEEFGGFELWNELQSRGHEIGAHSWAHERLAHMPLAEAKASIARCLDFFEANLDGFRREAAVFYYPFNASTPELEAYTLTQTRALRAKHLPHGINPMPTPDTQILRTVGKGPHNCEHHLELCLNEWLSQEHGWLIYNLHGLDDEGWGPIRASYLRGLLERLTTMDHVAVVTPLQALNGTWKPSDA